jgi:hypothetical protein
VFDRILKEMRDKNRNREYIMTVYGEEEMDNDSLTIFDVERCILNGKILELRSLQLVERLIPKRLCLLRFGCILKGKVC